MINKTKHYNSVAWNYDNSLFYKLSQAKKDNYFLFIEYLIRYANKENIISISRAKIIKYLSISERTLYRWLKDLVDSDIIIRLKKDMYMINPNIIINYRKTKNNDISNLIEQYRIYKEM